MAGVASRGELLARVVTVVVRARPAGLGLERARVADPGPAEAAEAPVETVGTDGHFYFQAPI